MATRRDAGRPHDAGRGRKSKHRRGRKRAHRALVPPRWIHYNARVHLYRGNLFLVGLPGAGKSTLGRQLARRLAKTFVDADAELERKLGVTIPTIFEIEGEASFRDREEAVLAELTTLSNIVLATGGGAVLRPANRERLRTNGTVIYLHAMPETLRERTRRSRHRPLLNAADPLARLAELYAQRDPLYRDVATTVIESSRDEIARFSRELEAVLPDPLDA